LQQFGLNYSREFKGGISMGLSPSYSRIDYIGFSSGFNATRKDRQYTMQFTILDRRFDLGGFTPRIIYTYTRNDSNVPLYAFNRNRVEFGVTRSF
ncbi:MAG: DUF560 domain-containing protein, partial [Alphaproteobacteria bacterium]|nr:DUF560 domain-containing protein [Alphaproteobacteria bacterium]